MKIAIVTYWGTNCERDVFFALERTGFSPFYVAHTQRELPPQTDGVVIPGGFSFGDYLCPGTMAKAAPISQDLLRKAHRGMPILGICNGFQILCELQLLPGILLKNLSGKFICRLVHLRITNTSSLFLQHIANRNIALPIAHKYGNYFSKSPQKVSKALLYATPSGEIAQEANPNGSLQNIAGITNRAGNILGLMPHPERRIHRLMGGEEGRWIFEGFRNFSSR